MKIIQDFYLQPFLNIQIKDENEQKQKSKQKSKSEVDQKYNIHNQIPSLESLNIESRKNTIRQKEDSKGRSIIYLFDKSLKIHTNGESLHNLDKLESLCSQKNKCGKNMTSQKIIRKNTPLKLNQYKIDEKMYKYLQFEHSMDQSNNNTPTRVISSTQLYSSPLKKIKKYNQKHNSLKKPSSLTIDQMMNNTPLSCSMPSLMNISESCETNLHHYYKDTILTNKEVKQKRKKALDNKHYQKINEMYSQSIQLIENDEGIVQQISQPQLSNCFCKKNTVLCRKKQLIASNDIQEQFKEYQDIVESERQRKNCLCRIF